LFALPARAVAARLFRVKTQGPEQFQPVAIVQALRPGDPFTI